MIVRFRLNSGSISAQFRLQCPHRSSFAFYGRIVRYYVLPAASFWCTGLNLSAVVHFGHITAFVVALCPIDLYIGPISAQLPTQNTNFYLVEATGA